MINQSSHPSLGPLPRWLIITAISAIIVRIVVAPLPELLPEEAYYWNYAIHLAPGYLDHPPFSAWLIAAGTAIFGLNEFGVRVGALVCSLVTLFFVYKLSTQLFHRTVGLGAACVGATLPYFIGNGFYLSPDAALVAAWSAALFIITSIILAGPNDRRQTVRWLALGVTVGIGLLSKYTMALVPICGVIIFALDRELRRWLLRPAPYLGVILAIAIFSPVIYWNATHEWASLVFQGSRRLSEPARFSLFDLLGQILMMGTPVGVMVAVSGSWEWIRGGHGDTRHRAAQRFLAATFLLPALLFLIFSFQHQARVNWTGPLFLGVLPLFAHHVLGAYSLPNAALNRWVVPLWKIFLPLAVGGFGLFWLYGGVGIPGVPYPRTINKLIGWEYLGEKIQTVRDSIRAHTGKEPLIIGMDKHYTAAQLAFYIRRAAPHDPAPAIAGRSLFGMESLMFKYWVPAGPHAGRDAILVARSESDLRFPELEAAYDRLDPIEPVIAERGGKAAGRYFYRIGHNFRPDSDEHGE